jgi:hypothetical protein
MCCGCLTCHHRPPEAVIGLITFAGIVHVYELAFEAMPKAHVLSGEKDVSLDKLKHFLGVGLHRQGEPTPPCLLALS